MRYLKILLLLSCLLAIFANPLRVEAVAGINRTINFQGKVVNKGVGLTDGTNVVNGNYDYIFSLWSTLSAGTSLWTETWNSGTTQVPVGDGIFNVALGTYATFPPTVDFNSDSIYLSVNFNGDGDMSPRIRFTAVPYALNAEKVAGLTVTNTTGTLTIPNGKTIYFGDNFSTTGVGITLDQSMATTNSVTFGALSIGGSVTFTGVAVGTGTTVLYIGSDGKLVQGTLPPGGNASATNGLSLISGSVGLGGTLTQVTEVGTSSFSLSFGVGNTQTLFIGTSGWVGIGTTNPGYKLDVVGNANISTNLSVGGSVTFSGVAVGTGSTVLYIGSDGKLVQGTLPPSGAASATNGLKLISGAVGLGGTLTQNTDIGISSFNFSFVGLGSTQVFYVGSNGTIGIGTSGMGHLFNVAGAGNSGYVAGIYNDNTSPTAGGLYLNSDGYGSILGIGQGATDVVLISALQSLFNNPANFTSSGDVGIAYDLYLTNQTSNNIKSYGPLVIESGELYESLDLTLRTNNAGNIVLDVGPSGQVMISTGTGKTTPTLFVLDNGSSDPGGTNGALYYSTATSKLRCYQNGAWTDCVSAGSTYSSKLVISPEYPGASLTKDGSTTNDGSMTSDNNLNAGTSGWRNYYEWTSTNAALQDYSILARVTIPGDFDSWETGACPGSTCALEFNYQTGVGATGDNYISFLVNSDSENQSTAICTIGSTASTGWSTSGCTDAILNDGSAPEWDAAGETAIIRIKVAAKNTGSALTRAGDIVLRYKAR